MHGKTHTCAIILAAGSGSRMNADVTKQRMLVGGMSVMRRTVTAFVECEDIDSITVVVKADEVGFAREELLEFNKRINIVVGGKNRAESARLAVESLDEHVTHIAIHDCARCLITPQMISRVVKEAVRCGAASAVCKVYDTIKLLDDSGAICSTVDRSRLVRAMTPQAFDIVLYREAMSRCEADDGITDDNMLLERMGSTVSPIDVGSGNIKITTMQDIRYAEFLLMEDGIYV